MRELNAEPAPTKFAPKHTHPMQAEKLLRIEQKRSQSHNCFLLQPWAGMMPTSISCTLYQQAQIAAWRVTSTSFSIRRKILCGFSSRPFKLNCPRPSCARSVVDPAAHRHAVPRTPGQTRDRNNFACQSRNLGLAFTQINNSLFEHHLHRKMDLRELPFWGGSKL